MEPGSATSEPYRRQPRPLPDIGSADLTVSEVKDLWYFNDGSIMDPHARQRLRRYWGHCPRHSWAAAVVECELRHVPFGTTILLEDLTRRAAEAVRGVLPWPVRLRRLRSRGTCATCEYLAGVESDDPNWVEKTKVVNTRRRFRRYARDVAHVWRRRTCPACLGGEGLLCREHLLVDEHPPSDLAGSLDALAERLHAFRKSMTMGGRLANELERASWVESLGWLYGWDYPYRAGLVAPLFAPG